MRTVTCLLLAALLGACSSQPPEPSYYLLRSDQPESTRALRTSSEYALGQVEIAPYVDQPGLVLEMRDGEMRPARQHLWAEPLYDSVRVLLLQEISAAYGADILPQTISGAGHTISVRIDQFHGTAAGTARLVAYWWLHDSGGLQTAYQFGGERALAGDGYGALAAAQKALLKELAVAIAGSLSPATASTSSSTTTFTPITAAE